MRVLAVVLPLMPGVALAHDWVVPDGAAFVAALTARVLQDEGGALQTFFADRQTLFEAPGVSWVRRWVQGAHNCSAWPPSARWTCSDVAQRRCELRFGAALVGHCIDLHQQRAGRWPFD
jgi:hypothetical protein